MVGGDTVVIVAAHAVVAASVMWAIRPWGQRLAVGLLAALLGRMPAPAGIVATMALAGHRAWFSPRFMVAVIGIGAVGVTFVNVWALPSQDYAAALLVAAALVDLTQQLPSVRTHWRTLLLAVAAVFVCLAVNVAVAVFVLAYWLTRGGARSALSLTLAIAIVGALVVRSTRPAGSGGAGAGGTVLERFTQTAIEQYEQVPALLLVLAGAALMGVAYYAAEHALDGAVARFESNPRHAPGPPPPPPPPVRR